MARARPASVSDLLSMTFARRFDADSHLLSLYSNAYALLQNTSCALFLKSYKLQSSALARYFKVTRTR